MLCRVIGVSAVVSLSLIAVTLTTDRRGTLFRAF